MQAARTNVESPKRRKVAATFISAACAFALIATPLLATETRDGAGGNFGAPKSFMLQYWTGNVWRDVPDQQHIHAKPALDQVNRITLPMPLTATKIRVVFVNGKGRCGYVAVTERESWVPPPANATGQPLQ